MVRPDMAYNKGFDVCFKTKQFIHSAMCNLFPYSALSNIGYDF